MQGAATTRRLRATTGTPALVVGSAALVVAVVMAIFELAKEVAAPGLSKWESHVVTVAMTTLLSTVVAVFVVRQQRRAAAALRRNEEDLRTTLQSIGDGVITTDRAGRIARMNAVAERLTGWPVDEARGRPLAEVFRIVSSDTGESAQDPVARVIASGEIVGLANHTSLIARDGTARAIADAGAPIRNDHEELVGVVLSFRDVSEEERLRQQVVQTQRLDALGMLAGGVAHDFNNLLTAITGGAEMLRLDLADGNAVAAGEQADLILEAAARAADLTRRLLAFSRERPLGLSATDVHDAIRSAVALLRRTIDKRVEIATTLAAVPSVVLGDATQLQALFLNLGVNAGHAMPGGGTLSFSSRTIDLDETTCQSSPFGLKPGPHVLIDVRDGGAGIPPDVVGRIFDPFFTTKAPGAGTGLGLSAAYGTVKQHRGAITVQSEVGKGTLFQITLALTESAMTRTGASPAPKPGTGRVLLIDDEAMVRLTAHRVLQHLGYEVVQAANGREGLEVFDREQGRFDLVLMDLMMPEMNGPDCVRELRKRSATVPVLLCSGFARGTDVEALTSDGATSFVSKPYTTLELSLALAAALGRS